MKLNSVRFRLTLLNIGVMALILLSFLIIVHFLVRTHLISQTDRRLQGMAQRQVDFFNRFNDDGRLPRPGGPERLPGRNRSRISHPVRTFNMKGQLLTPAGTLAEVQDPLWDRQGFSRAAGGEPNFTTYHGNDVHLRVYSLPLRRENRTVGVVQAAVSLTDINLLLDSLTVTLIILIPIALVIAGISGLFLSSRALKPVRHITAAADAINASDLSLRLPVVGTDEFADLAGTINNLLARLEEAFIQLREAFEKQQRFTADASHELRTPLTVVKANTSLALRAPRTPAEYQEALQSIDASADIMNRLVQDLLLLARSDSGQLALEPQAIDPRTLFQDAVCLTSNDHSLAPIHITVADDAGFLWGDYHHLQRLIINLLDNALRYTPAEGKITARAERCAEQMLLEVADTGEGIAAEHIPHLGERFYRTDKARARQHGGTGLGLAICRSIVEAHKGSMTIVSEPGRGTCVSCRLPRVEDAGLATGTEDPGLCLEK